jgi:iron complex outermembrane receptor protein
MAGAACAALIALPAAAQDASGQAPAEGNNAQVPTSVAPETETGNDIVVTGTLFRRTDTETVSPVTSLSADAIQQRGLTTIADAVQSLAAGNGGNIPQGFTGAFASGSSAISLRGLTTNSTLTLFDGLRAASYPLADDGQRSFVDLNTIPSAIVDQIQVLRDGASSTYGADAIAGVVNVILKKEIKGINGRAEAGISDRGDAANQRLQLTLGYGDLDEQGFNVYISGEYQHQESLFARDRGFPYNTNNLTSIDAGNGFTGRNGNFGATPPTSASSSGATTAIVRPATLTRPGDVLSGVATATGQFAVLSPTGNCAIGQVTHTNSAGRYCEQDLVNDYTVIMPNQTRFGGTLHATANVGENAQAYLTATYYVSRVLIDQSPQSIRSNGNPFETRGISLPALLSNGTLNPQNPFAASGQAALIYYRFGDIDSSLQNEAKTFRVAGGVDGTFGDGFGYSLSGTYMRTDLDQTRRGFLYVPALLNAVRDGTYNFVDPSQNSETIRDTIAPTFYNRASSELWQLQATLTKDLAQLPGGPLQLGGGAQIRYESIYDPTAVPNRDYITVNPFSAIGDRYVTGAFFELNAPVFEQLELNASGRYDHYSIGFDRFSPKIGAKFTPIREIAIRGTYSQGFRAPSIPETSGSVIGFTQYEPGTGLSAADRATLLARYGNNSYITGVYGLGNNSTGNPDVKPEKSRSFTGGVVFQPQSWLSLTVDYYNIRKKDLILSAGGNPALIASNYLLNGTIPDGVTLTLNPTDPANPTLRATPLSVNFLYSNGNTLQTSGIDGQISASIPIGDGVKFSSALEGTYIINYDIDDGTGSGIQKFAGTLASYAITSASGTPRWRANWQNTIETGPFTLTGTAYYVSGYKGYADDNTGPGSTCDQAIETSIRYDDPFNPLGGTGGGALQCNVDDFISVDFNAQYKVNDNFTFYVNMINAFDAKAPFDPNTYGGNNYNPAFAASGIIGRLFRAGATFKF